MSRLRRPEYFLLDLGQSLVATFHGQIAAGDHDAGRLANHGREQQFRQILEAAARFDLQHDSKIRCTQRAQVLAQDLDVAGTVNE